MGTGPSAGEIAGRVAIRGIQRPVRSGFHLVAASGGRARAVGAGGTIWPIGVAGPGIGLPGGSVRVLGKGRVHGTERFPWTAQVPAQARGGQRDRNCNILPARPIPRKTT